MYELISPHRSLKKEITDREYSKLPYHQKACYRQQTNSSSRQSSDDNIYIPPSYNEPSPDYTPSHDHGHGHHDTGGSFDGFGGDCGGGDCGGGY